MSTIKQIAANRENCKKSTGPRTEEGRRRASQNAVTHGLHSHNFLLDIENEDSYHLYHHQLIHDWQPKSGTEFLLVEQVAQSYFLKRRFLTKMPDLHLTEQRNYSNETLISYPILMKMITQADRMMHRALEKLEMIRLERKKEEAKHKKANDPASAPPPSLKPDDLDEIGFVSSPFATLSPDDPYPTRDDAAA